MAAGPRRWNGLEGPQRARAKSKLSADQGGPMSTLRKHFISFATAYAKQSGDADEFVIPEDLTELSDEDLSALHDQALANFDSMYGDGTDLTDDDYSVLSDLTEGIERLSSELTDRETAATERSEKAAELAARVRPSSE